MTLYAKIDQDGLIDFVVNSPVPQPGLAEIAFDPGPAPGRWQRFSVTTMQWVDPRTEQQKYDFAAQDVRIQRNRLLQESDWTDTVSAPARLGEQLYQQWQDYRQELRDITDQPGYPFDIVWPTPPQ